MKAVIMAGGFGTRLRPITEGIPKPCVPILGEPCIVRTVRSLAGLGIREIHVSLFYLPERIREALDLPEFADLKLVFHRENVPLGTAGSVRNCMEDCDEDFVVVSGDAVFDFDLSPVFDFHSRHGGSVTVVTSRVLDPEEFGVILRDGEGRITRFSEKPDWSHVCSDDANTGIYVCSPSFLNCIPQGVSDFSRDVFPSMMDKGQPVYCYSADGYWCDVGTVSSYLECNSRLLRFGAGAVGSPVDGETVVEGPCYIGKNVRMKNCRIGPGTVIGDGCVLEGARLEGCVLHSRVRCEDGVAVRNAVICEGAVLHRKVRIGDECVVGADCALGAGVTVSAGVKIYPSNRIPAGVRLSENVYRRMRNPVPEEGTIYFPFGEDFGGAGIYETGRALAELFGGDLAVGRAEPRDAASTMTFCGGVLASGKNVYDTGVNDLSRFRFILRNYAFRGGAFFDRNYSNLVLRIFDGNGMPLSHGGSKRFLRCLTEPSSCGDSEGSYRVFRGGAKSYLSYLRSFGLPGRLTVRTVPSPILSSLLPALPEPEAKERLRVGPCWVRVERENGEPFDEDLIRLSACVALGRIQSSVYIPESYPAVAEEVGRRYGFRVLRVPEGDGGERKLFPLTDPNVQGLLILGLLDRENCSFEAFAEKLPHFAVKQRDVSVPFPCGSVMRTLIALGGTPGDGVRFSDHRGTVRIVPKATEASFRIVSEASDSEQAEELCDFYALKLKGLKPD